MTEKQKIYLVSAELPGCGSSSLSKEISRQRGCGVISIGKGVREDLQVENENQLQASLDRVEDPMEYDRQFYQELNSDRDYVIDGKLATTVGPHFLSDNQIVKVDLTSNYLLSAKRVIQREIGRNALTLLIDDEGPELLLTKMNEMIERANHDRNMRNSVESRLGIITGSNIERHLFDTTIMPVKEISHTLFEKSAKHDEFSDYELDALYDNLQSMREVGVALDRKQRLHPSDAQHLEHTLSRSEYKLKRLQATLSQEAIMGLRPDIRDGLLHGWANLFGRNAPRFNKTPEGEIVIDYDTTKYSPEYYKISELYQAFRHKFTNKTILDPFGGSGMMLNVFAARGIASEITLTDIQYDESNGNVYVPNMNLQSWQLAFDNLPSWYHPKIYPVKTYAMDARELKFPDKSFDFVVTDPPYGKNCLNGNLQIVKESIPELLRVAKEGVFMLVPEEWNDQLDDIGYSSKKITKDTSSGMSGLPTCWVQILEKEWYD
jgi:16S rRNA G966 N2-methylase RsmD